MSDGEAVKGNIAKRGHIYNPSEVVKMSYYNNYFKFKFMQKLLFIFCTFEYIF